MKNITSLLSLSLWIGSAVAQAAVVDQFDCQIQIKNELGVTLLQTSSSLAVARLPLNASPASDVRLTSGEARITPGSTGHSGFSVDSGLPQFHAELVEAYPAGIFSPSTSARKYRMFRQSGQSGGFGQTPSQSRSS